MARISHNDLRYHSYATVHNWNLTFGIPITVVQAINLLPKKVTAKAATIKGTTYQEITAQNIFDITTGNIINLYCETAELPNYEIQFADIMINGTKTQQPIGSNVNGVISLTFLEDEQHWLSRFFEIWRDLSMSITAEHFLPRTASMAPRGFFMDLLNGMGNITARYELFNVCPGHVKLDDLMPDASVQRLNVSMYYNSYKRLL